MKNPVKDTKFDELLEFPCQMNFKIMGLAQDTLVSKIVEVLQLHAPGDYSPTTKPSSKGTYYSVNVGVTVTSKEHIELLYNELGNIDIVRYVL
ncbi:MAG: putative lipoic acid-binding regulatory protein [Alteromonadaceae bacterium]|jgi:putative lipoic acid-binding regulatory protein